MIRTLLFSIGLSVVSAHTYAKTCELDRKIRFAGLDWDSNGFLTETARYIVEEGFECETASIPGSTFPLLSGMIKGDIDIMMEVWKDNMTEAWDKGVNSGKIQKIGISFKGAVQGFYIPRYVVEGDKKRNIAPMAPDLKHVKDLPKYKHLFKDREEPSKGRFYNCILGWSCEIVNTNKLAAYQLDDHYTNFRPGAASALSSAIASAYKRGKPFLAYYWEPTWIMGEYDLLKLEEPEYDEKLWSSLTKKNAKNPVGVAYPAKDIILGVNSQFATSAPKITSFLKKFTLSKDKINTYLAVMQNKNATQRQAAIEFLKDNKNLWKPWIAKDIAAKVERKLNSSHEI